MNAKKLIQIAGLLLFTVGLPLGSYWYLKAGYDYHKEALNKLEMLGEIPANTKVSSYPDSLDVDLALDGKLGLVFTLHSEDSLIMSLSKKLFAQFESSNAAYVNVFVTDDMAVMLEKKDWKPKNQLCRLFNLQNEDNFKVYTSFFQLQEKCSGETTCPAVALIDANRQIRKYYDLNDVEQLKELVRVSAIILPKSKVEDPELRRQKEM